MHEVLNSMKASIIFGFALLLLAGLVYFPFRKVAFAQNPQGDTIKLGSFTPTIEPSPTRVPTTVPFNTIAPKQTTAPAKVPNVSPTTKTAAPSKLMANCDFEMSDFTEFREYGGMTYGLFPKTVDGKGLAGWYWLFAEHTTKTPNEQIASLTEFEKHVSLKKDDIHFKSLKNKRDCPAYSYTYCAYLVAQLCTKDCTTPNPQVSPPPVAKVSPTPKPAQSTGSPTNSTGYDANKLCIPVEVNGSQADKMDMLIIPLNFTAEERETLTYELAQRGARSLSQTNLSNHPDDILKKMNWFLLNIDHPDFLIEGLRQYEGGDRSDLIDLGINADYCGRDRFMIIVKGEYRSAFAVRGIGGVVWSSEVDGDGLTFVHEWGHAAGDLMDEYPGAVNTEIAANCTTIPGSLTNSGNTTAPCPQWDCSKIQCSPKAQQLLQGMGCYPRCAKDSYYRSMPNSVMDNLDQPGGNVFNGPSLVYMIEKVFTNYR